MNRHWASLMILSFLLFCSLVPNSSAWATAPDTRYVANTGNDAGDCSSPLSPCRTIQYATNQAVSGDTILVAQGTYYYDPSVDPCSFLQNRAVVCFVDKQLTILGGYTLTNWFQANLTENPTIIDGQNTYRGVAAIGYATTTAHLSMEGFLIRNCKAQGPAYLNPYDPSGFGGGMLVQHAFVTLRDVIFRNNQAVGQNTASGVGGQADGAALRIEEPPLGTTSLLQRVTFDGNQSYGGTGPERGGVAFGALFIYKATVIIEDTQFTNNLARAGNSTGSGSYGSPPNADALGGGMAVEEGILTLRRVTATGNRVQGGNATSYGGGAFGGGIFIEDFGNRATSATISDSYIANNIAIAGAASTGGVAAGGGIDVDSSHITLERTRIISNSVTGGSSPSGSAGPGAGGGIYVFAVREGPFQANFNNIIVAQNFAASGSGTTNAGNGGGGGIVIHGVNATINHATIAYNRLAQPLSLGQGLLVQPWPSPLSPQWSAVVNLNHSLIAHHTVGGASSAAVVVQQNSTLTFNRGLFAANTKDTNANNTPVPAGTINGLTTMQTATSAKFIAPDQPYFNYHLRGDSPAVDQATGSTMADDIDRQQRPYGAKSDYGADEYVPFALAVAVGDQTLRPDWTNGAQLLEGGVGHYEVTVTCQAGATPPDQMNCGEPLNVGLNTTVWLTGLTNFKQYGIEVKAYDPANTWLATSTQVTVFPSNLLIFLPLVMKK